MHIQRLLCLFYSFNNNISHLQQCKFFYNIAEFLQGPGLPVGGGLALNSKHFFIEEVAKLVPNVIVGVYQPKSSINCVILHFRSLFSIFLFHLGPSNHFVQSLQLSQAGPDSSLYCKHLYNIADILYRNVNSFTVLHRLLYIMAGFSSKLKDPLRIGDKFLYESISRERYGKCT